ncbi:immunity protein 49 of polymorphic toxin system [Streptomyces capillispiralis]|uniref:Immunity protein 49 of polymorphic toxin system n=1 Tax=Streptomyces capillispiralis TaxID=68182 RepID=A0A561TJQ5_9ACTN|nr:immunity protein 49 of polymorphic toxin system [Streptomyces capillispiralis]
MSISVLRPPLEGSHPNPDELRQEINERTLRRVERLETYPQSFGLTFSSAVSSASLQTLDDPTADKLETWEAWVMAMQVGSALFASATAPEGSTVECVIGHEVRTIPAVGITHFVDAGTWLEAFWLAVVCRDQVRVTQLCEVPVETLRASGAVFEEYIYHWVDVLQTYWLERPGLGDKLVAAFEGTDPDRLRFLDRETMLKVLYPPINLFYRFLGGDADQFNAALVQALELHKEYWTANEEREESGDGDIPLAILAITCLAHDAGRPVEVESEYLPEHLLKRSWLGEFPT